MCARRGNGLSSGEKLPFRFDGAGAGHYYKVTIADGQFPNVNDGAAVLRCLGNEVEAGELTIPLGVRGHYLERMDADKTRSVTWLTRNCDENHERPKSIACSYYQS